MITKWGLKNFKSIREVDLDLAPLTVITGVNSSGKSSLLHSMAMMAQSARNKDKTKRITLRGEDEKNEDILFDLGEFKNILCNNPCETWEYQYKHGIIVAFTISTKEYEYHRRIQIRKKMVDKKKTHLLISSVHRRVTVHCCALWAKSCFIARRKGPSMGAEYFITLYY